VTNVCVGPCKEDINGRDSAENTLEAKSILNFSTQDEMHTQKSWKSIALLTSSDRVSKYAVNPSTLSVSFLIISERDTCNRCKELKHAENPQWE